AQRRVNRTDVPRAVGLHSRAPERTVDTGIIGNGGLAGRAKGERGPGRGPYRLNCTDLPFDSHCCAALKLSGMRIAEFSLITYFLPSSTCVQSGKSCPRS